jgi:hypothetical protein
MPTTTRSGQSDFPWQAVTEETRGIGDVLKDYVSPSVSVTLREWFDTRLSPWITPRHRRETGLHMDINEHTLHWKASSSTFDFNWENIKRWNENVIDYKDRLNWFMENKKYYLVKLELEKCLLKCQKIDNDR